MKKLLVSCIAAISLSTNVTAQTWTWAETAGGILPDEANGCFLDDAGNMYMSGFYFSSDINFGNGNELSNNGLSDGFTVKYNSNGSTQWASKVKGSGEDKATKCTADKFGNVITTGYFASSSIQFGGNNNHSVSNSNGSGFDGFIVKYNSSGTPQWFHAIGAADDDGGASVATDTLGNVYVTGWWRASSMTVGSTVLTNNGDSDMFLIKYDPNGNVLWAKNAGGPDDDKGRGCTVDVDGNVIVTGYSKPTFMTIEGNTFPNNGSKDFFVIKYSSDGTLIGAKTYGGTGSEEAFACSSDGSGNIYIAGNYSSSSVTFDAVTMTNPGSGSGAFLLKLDPSLTAVWARGFSSDDSDEALGCSVDTYGNSVVTGVFSGNSLTIGNTSLNNNGGDEIFLAKYDPNGNLFWAKKIGKSNDDGSNDCSIADNGRVIIAGYYNSGSLTLGNIDLDNSYFGIATSDVFIGQTCNALQGIDNVSACGSYTWINGETYTSDNNTAVYQFPNNGGSTCDSMLTLNLSIGQVDVSVTENAPTITANATNASYKWLDCDNGNAFISGETGAVFTPSSNGSFAVEVTQNGCVDTSDCVAVNLVGINEIYDDSFKLYPNPATNSVTIESIDNAQKTVELYNHTGQLVFSNVFSDESKTLHLNSLPQGVYFVSVRSANSSITKRLVLLN